MTDTAPQLPDTSTWRKIEPGETVPAGTSYLVTNGKTHIINEVRNRDIEVSNTEASTYYADLPAPGPDLSLIPEGRENAQVLRINGVAGTYFQADGRLYMASLVDAYASDWCLLASVESVEPVTILGDDEVAVPRELVERAKDYVHWMTRGPRGCEAPGDSATILRDLAALGEDDR